MVVMIDNTSYEVKCILDYLKREDVEHEMNDTNCFWVEEMVEDNTIKFNKMYDKEKNIIKYRTELLPHFSNEDNSFNSRLKTLETNVSNLNKLTVDQILL